MARIENEEKRRGGDGAPDGEGRDVLGEMRRGERLGEKYSTLRTK